jgi:ribokinase
MVGKIIAVVGSVNLDLVCTTERIPVVGETITGGAFQTFNGGKGANQAVAIARQGYRVCMIAKVGDDEFGERLRSGLRRAGVNVRAVSVATGISSGVALISTDRQGQNSIVVVPGANGKLRPADIRKALPLLCSAGMILTQLEIPMETVEYLASVAGRLNIPFMLDPAPAQELSGELLRKVDYLTPNETETCILCGIDTGAFHAANVAEYAQMLRDRGARRVIIKMGAQGAYICDTDGSGTFLPALQVQVVDSTGAGDAFNGGLAVAIMHRQTLEEAARYASAVAAISVTRMGAQASMPSARKVKKLLRCPPALVSHDAA